MKKNKIVNLLILSSLFILILFKIFQREYFNIFNQLLNYIAIIIVLKSSIYFTIKLNFLQFNIFKIYKTIKSSTKDDLKALFVSLGGKIGVGSIIGICIAINNKGPGVIMWIWIISILSSILAYVETYLGILYKKNSSGGVFYYIKKGLNNEKLAIIYSIILIFIYIIGFIGIQSNTIISITNNITNINKYILIIILCYIVIIIIFNSTKNIISTISKIVPIMCLIYLLSCLIIITKNINKVADIIILIIEDGTKIDRFLIGTIIVGLQRGIFATESGIGTSSIASNIGENEKEIQGIFQVIGIHFISIFIITITSIIILLNNNLSNDSINILINIFNNYYGTIGKILLCIIITLFALSTIISGYYYSIKGLEFINKENNSFDYLFLKILVIVIVFLGGIVKSSIIWSIIDTLILYLLFINIYSMISLRKKIN